MPCNNLMDVLGHRSAMTLQVSLKIALEQLAVPVVAVELIEIAIYSIGKWLATIGNYFKLTNKIKRNYLFNKLL